MFSMLLAGCPPDVAVVVSGSRCEIVIHEG